MRELCVLCQVLNGALLQQTFVVEFTVHNQMCDDCHRVEAKDYWRSCVQVRQKVCADVQQIHCVHEHSNNYTNNNNNQDDIYSAVYTAPAICDSSLWIIWSTVGQRQVAAKS